ncbi:GNAT family N-acetyltransferase [Clostridium sp. FP1]|uniref:GNAT family N-acetyltransferase n=1 Tax=Clostridium sp. FP1 TaxID=2724076 RepID=UPI0013E990C1|nr:GNAT family N-acetyltransferase [Clostridium sp. FP1]MBZ9635766.1 GNAT family N-acetyltransferase [Clostridium sp. FP1]
MLSYRKFDKESDYNIMRCIVQHNCAQTGHLYPQLHIGNLDFERYAFEESPDILYKTTWFVSDNKMEIGFITVEKDEFYITLLLEFEHHTEYILDYIEHNCFIHGDIITTDANSEDKLLSNILEERGYTKTARSRFNGICDLSKISTCSPLPDGFSMRLSQMKDVERRAEIFGLATGGIGTTAERYERMMSSPSYCYAMDLVVQTDKAEIIAYCTIWEDPVSKIAILEPVACVEEHRRKGIMKSTLLYGMNLLKERGTKYIYVGTGGNNIASQTLYKSVGFLEYGINCEWQKTV